jgi:hypothetical protein
MNEGTLFTPVDKDYCIDDQVLFSRSHLPNEIVQISICTLKSED